MTPVLAADTSVSHPPSGTLYSVSGENRHLRVRSLPDLKTYIHAHIERVTILGLEIRRRHFRDVDPHLLRQFLELHDQSKINLSDAFVNEFGINRKEHPFLQIAAIWNRNDIHQNGTEEERARIARMRAESNRIDTELQMKFFRAHKLLDAQGRPGEVAKTLMEIERIADRVDRAKAPVTAEEFNRPMASAAQWLDSPREKSIATEMEKDWAYFTRGASYEEFRGRRLVNPAGIIRSACSEAYGKLLRKEQSPPPLDAAAH